VISVTEVRLGRYPSTGDQSHGDAAKYQWSSSPLVARRRFGISVGYLAVLSVPQYPRGRSRSLSRAVMGADFSKDIKAAIERHRETLEPLAWD
jgi:hypothetical protein